MQRAVARTRSIPKPPSVGVRGRAGVGGGSTTEQTQKDSAAVPETETPEIGKEEEPRCG